LSEDEEGNESDVELRSFVKKVFLFSVGFLIVLLLLAREFIMHSLSPRGLAIGLFILFVVSFLVLTLTVFRRRSVVPMLESPGASTPDVTSDRRRVLGIRAGKTAIVVLALLLLNGLRQIGSVPLLPLLAGVTANVLTIVAVVWVVLRLQRRVK
jgi:hypothetical protein